MANENVKKIVFDKRIDSLKPAIDLYMLKSSTNIGLSERDKPGFQINIETKNEEKENIKKLDIGKVFRLSNPRHYDSPGRKIVTPYENSLFYKR